MPDHRLSDADAQFWAEPFVTGIPARTWSYIAWVSVSVWTAAVLLALVLGFHQPAWTSSPLETVAIVGMIVGFVVAFVAFPAMFRQAHREMATGYCTVAGFWVRGTTPLVNPRTRRIEGGSTDRFDAAAARARAPWAQAKDHGAQPPLAPMPAIGPQFTNARAILRSSAIASILLAAIAIWVRSQDGKHSVLVTLLTGAIVFGGLLVAFLAAAFTFRAMQANRLAKVRQVAGGIVLACYIAPQSRASQDRLGLRKGTIPWVPVLVFDADGFSIWRASRTPEPVVNITRRDVVSLDVTRILSGRVTTPSLQIGVIPPDERLPFILEFTIFDPSRPLFANSEEKISALIRSITVLWSH